MSNALESVSCQRPTGTLLGSEHAGIINQHH
jgi:hypothetical protein